jgi:DnaA family protein
MSEQLALGLQLRASARFSNFVAAGHSELLEHLQACCRHADSAGRRAAYLSLADQRGLRPEVLTGWEQFQLVCLDDIDAAAADPAWEEALFHFYNRLAGQGNRLLVSAAVAPGRLGIGLADLRSRLAAGPVYQLHALNDEQSREAMRLRARERGFELPEDTARFLLRHWPRDLPALMTLLERLDGASLAAQRRLTVPFVKSVLGL